MTQTSQTPRSQETSSQPLVDAPDTGADAKTQAPKAKGRKRGKAAGDAVPSKFLRITYLLPRDRIKRLEWLMARTNAATKVDLLRMALNRFEREVIREEAELEEQRKRAGAPDIGRDV